MLSWLIAIAGGISLLGFLALLRSAAQSRLDLEQRVAMLEERLLGTENDAHRREESVDVLQRLLLDKGVADEDDFEAARRAGEPPGASHSRPIH